MGVPNNSFASFWQHPGLTFGPWAVRGTAGAPLAIHREGLRPLRRPLRIRLARALTPEWLAEDADPWLFVPSLSTDAPKGEPLAWFSLRRRFGEGGFSDPSREFPAILAAEGRIVFLFDPVEAVDWVLFERYCRPARPYTSLLPFHYHVVPGQARVAIHRLVKGVLGRFRRPVFPAWPVDGSVELVRGLVLKAAECVHGPFARGQVPPAGEARPYGGWPEGKRFAVALTHDVDTAEGYPQIPEFLAVEKAHGVTSCWNVVLRSCLRRLCVLDALAGAGHEIGLHGSSHDNRLAFLEPSAMRRRFEACEPICRAYQIRGFRSPSLCRTNALFERIAERFDYDSSCPDTESGTGCCTVFPFFRGRLLELPLSVPLDSALLARGYSPARILRVWREKIAWIRRVGGLAVVGVHPERHFSGNRGMLAAYDRLLDSLCADPQAWIARPRDVARWWREGPQKGVANEGRTC